MSTTTITTRVSCRSGSAESAGANGMSRSGGGGAERQLQLVPGCQPRCTHEGWMPGRAAGLQRAPRFGSCQCLTRVISDPLPWPSPTPIQRNGVRRSLWAFFVLDLSGRLDKGLMTAPAVWGAVWPKYNLTRLNFVPCAGFGLWWRRNGVARETEADRISMSHE